jgi:hypothetical protein
MDQGIVPPFLWSGSRHICTIFPDSWILPWTTTDITDEKERYRILLNLDPESFEVLQNKFHDLHSKDQFGFPNVFYSVGIAQSFYRDNLSHLPNLKLVSIALSDSECEQFVQESEPPPGFGENGIHRMMRYGQILKEDVALVMGFDVLGYDDANFCSFLCNSLERDYHDVLGVDLNNYGLIDTFEIARRAAVYTMQDDVGAEPYNWRTWKISEYPLD